jgi:hypothetical protein
LPCNPSVKGTDVTKYQTEYPVLRGVEKPPHGNTKTGLPFYRLGVGDSFDVPPEQYARASSARAHFQKKRRMQGENVVITSGQVRDGSRVIGYRFTRIR